MNNSQPHYRLIHSRLAFLGILAILMFVSPLITLARGYWLGLPTIYHYLFGGWLILIVLAYLLQRQNRKKYSLDNSKINIDKE